MCRLLSPTAFKKLIKVGKNPGVTRRNVVIPLDGFTIVDMPGFGYMKNVSRETERKVQEDIISFIDEHHQSIFLAIEVINLPVFRAVFTKYEGISTPFDKELFTFLREHDIPTVILANKVDKLPKRVAEEEIEFLMDALDVDGIGPGFDRRDVIPFSTRTRTGLDELERKIQVCLAMHGKRKNNV